MVIDRPECREWIANPSYTLFKPANESLRVDYIEVTLDQVLFWCRYHGVVPPEIVLKDLADRKKASATCVWPQRRLENPPPWSPR